MQLSCAGSLAQILFDWRIAHGNEETRQEGCEEAGGEEDLEEEVSTFFGNWAKGGDPIVPLRCLCNRRHRQSEPKVMPHVLAVDTQHPDPAAVAELAAAIAAGAVVAVPTDTVYGLAANALDPAAVAAVFALKGRAFDQPLPIAVSGRAQAAALAASLPPAFERLARAFWPGALTLVVPAGPRLPSAVTAGRGAVGLRQPDLPLLAELLRGAGMPLTLTSANRSGQPACRTAAAVAEQFGEACPLLADGGTTPTGLASTVVDVCGPEPRILRAGAIPAERLEAVWRGLRVS
jgi:L-threonylcarbamoyladenylate synthase